jgi:rfaE bifunctional protein nucleotidyltransferase chain/domain/rfaE bifunctional protein kinase chain/domain
MSDALVIVGDAMLDRDIDGSVERICPEAPVPVLDESAQSLRPGGAALAAALSATSGPTTLVTALGDDQAGATIRELLEQEGVAVLDLGMDGATPEKIRLRSDGRTLLRVDRGGNGGRPRLGDADRLVKQALTGAAGVLVADYGRGMTSHPELRRLLAARAAAVPIVWDPHPRGREPVAHVALATPNRREAGLLAADVRGSGLRADAARARHLRQHWQADAVAVTLGADGALLDGGQSVPTILPGRRGVTGDPCGAGDCFATSSAWQLIAGSPTGVAVAVAVESATRYVTGQEAPPAATSTGSGTGLADALETADRVRSQGGVVVATGGCFDLLHAGHISTLEAARSLGDCLLVLLNSDRSVRALKGADRPLVSQEDRARVLESLACVDGVIIFDEPTPVAVLKRIRPHVFAKGGDYSGESLPETAVMRRFSGQTVILPSLEGRSTTRLISRAAGMPR